MTERKRLVKRMRRRLWGGTVDIRLYSDNTIRARCDHPSNDPEIEMAMAGRVLNRAREVYGPDVRFGPMTWRDDP